MSRIGLFFVNVYRIDGLEAFGAFHGKFSKIQVSTTEHIESESQEI